MAEDTRLPDPPAERTLAQPEGEAQRSWYLTALEVGPPSVASLVTIAAEGPKAMKNIRDAVEGVKGKLLPEPTGKHAARPDEGD